MNRYNLRMNRAQFFRWQIEYILDAKHIFKSFSFVKYCILLLYPLHMGTNDGQMVYFKQNGFK